ncbi:MAG: hypothetical protein WC683_17385 [bacterium]
MGHNTEVAADLVVNDKAGESIGRIQKSFNALDKKVNKVGSSLKKFATETASTALGVHLAGFGGTLTGIYHEALEAGMELGKQQKAVASALMMTDKGGRGYKEIREQANGLQEELQNLAIDAGASSDAVIESFNDIASRTNKSTDEVQEFMGTMVQAARIAPGGLASITQGFEQIEMGVARARNPIVQMIASTGLLKGNARQVAKEMQKMAPDKMMAIAEQAITRMAKKMKDVPLTFGESMQSLKEMRGQLYEIVGMPIFKGLTPMVQELRKQMTAHRHELEAFAEKVGEKATLAFKYAGDKVKDAFVLINENWEGIARSMGTVADTLMGAGKFLIDHKDTFTRMAQMGGGGYFNVARGHAGEGSAGGAGIVGDVLGGAALGGKLAGGMGAVGGALFGLTGALTEEAVVLYDSTLAEERRTGALRKTNEELDKRTRTAEEEAKRFAELQSFAKSLGLGAFGQKVEGRFTSKTERMPEGVGFAELSKKDVRYGIDEQTQEQAASMVKEFNASLEMAMNSTDKGRFELIGNILSHSNALQFALAKSGVDVGRGFGDLIDAMIAGGKMTAEAGAQAKKLVKGGKSLEGMSKPSINVNASGSTINVKQEFRDADPDRIMMVFKAGVTKAALARVNARVSGPFGGF